MGHFKIAPVRRLPGSALESGYETSAGRFAIATALANAVIYQVPLYAFALDNLDSLFPHGILAMASLFMVTFAASAIPILLLFALARPLVKAVCMAVAAFNATAVYFVATYRVFLDKDMMGNVLNTNAAEAAEFLHPNLVLCLIVLGAVPCWAVAKVRVRRDGRLRAVAWAVGVFVALLGWVYVTSSTWLWFDAHGKRLGGLVMPWSYAVNAVRYASENGNLNKEPLLLPSAVFASDARTVVILVIGEAARARNFSLYGYQRATNPKLTAAGAVPLRNSVACATYTTASLACMLHMNNGNDLLTDHEPLPDYLARHGVDVAWRTNNWGEPNTRIESYERAGDLRESCRGPGCGHDEVLLSRLSDRIESSPRRRTFIVLHQRGSHGPSYHDESPPEFSVFRPVCRSVDLDRCTRESLINAYDNTILYTDHFVAEAIATLRGLKNTSAALIYVSDHGESLGEGGFYLHGAPAAIAPDVQKRIPFVVWMSDAVMQRRGVSALTVGMRARHGHENVFHSVMGAFDMRSSLYDPGLDIFEPPP